MILFNATKFNTDNEFLFFYYVFFFLKCRPMSSESALLAMHAYTYKGFDSDFSIALHVLTEIDE